jgi:parvulin-like peptidyl-prolyl isomerase
MRLQSILLSIPFGIVPALAIGAAPVPSKVTSAYAVLKSAPPAPASGCRTTRTDGGEIRASLYSDDTAACPVARVADEPVPLGELADALAATHMAKDSKARKGARPQGMDFATTLDRMVDVRLIVQEAREMGLTEQPDYKATMEAYRASTLRTMLQEQAAAGAKPDKAEVDRLFKAAVKEWKVRSVMFDKEEDAKKFKDAVAKGGSFDKLAKASAAEKKARGGAPGYVSVQQMLPELAQAADKLKTGEVSPPVKVANGWVVLKLEGIRYPDNKKARADATAQSLADQQHKAVRKFHESLVKKYAKVDEKLFQSIDFEAGGEAGFKALEKDTRVLAQIDGEKPVTVGELTEEVSKKFFHGVADPIKEKRVNPTKVDTFERILGTRLFAREARERKLAQDPTFRRKVEEYDRVLAFSNFIEVVLVPGVKVTERDVQDLYEKRKDQFTFPQMYRIDAMAFDNTKAAQATMEKLKAGTDLEWLRANAEGQLKPDDQALQFQGTPVSVKGMPASLAKTLTGAQPGGYRLYATDDGKQHYVLRIAGQIPPTVKPYADVREELAREVEADKIAEAIRDYAAKLRKTQKVDVIIVRIAS